MRKGLSNCQCVEENLSASELMGFGARKFLIKRTFLSTSVLNNIYALYLLGPISAPILTNKKMVLRYCHISFDSEQEKKWNLLG